MTFSIILSHIFLPVVLIAWLAFSRHDRPWLTLAQIGAVGSALLALALAGVWIYPPWWASYLYGLVFLALATRAHFAVRDATGGRPRWRLAVHAVLCVGLLALALPVLYLAILGQFRPDGETVNLAFPLRGGPFFIVHGGSTELLNAHLKTLDATSEPRLRYRGQSFALDIVKTDAIGLRLKPEQRWQISVREPERYLIFGEPVFAACAGEVAATDDGHRDMPAPEMDRTFMTGNRVAVLCDDVLTIYAHLRQGSVAVAVGDHVDVHTKLGEVGNSGNSSEPHLHFHAQRPGDDLTSLAGEPVWSLFSGHFPVRNDRIRADRAGGLR